MRYRIEHTTTYTYNQPVTLQPHVVRLRPRCDSTQMVWKSSLKVVPEPVGCSSVVDLDGNSLAKLWFAPQPVAHLKITIASEVETYRTNPFDFLLEAWAVQLPIDYPVSLATQLHPYLQPTVPIDPIALQLAQQIGHDVNFETTSFLTTLNQQIYQTCAHTIRETGDPFGPGYTWTHKTGSCRDFTVLFMEVCRAVGLACRFVSGYQEGDQDSEQQRHLHAWPEVYLPGAGWRGYDPTHGLAVADRHIALVASPYPKYAAPITGSFTPGGTQVAMDYQVSIQPALAQFQQLGSLMQSQSF